MNKKRNVRQDCPRCGKEVSVNLDGNLRYHTRYDSRFVTIECKEEPFVKPQAVIVDIDGTVAIHGDHRSPYDWSKVEFDEPNHPVIAVTQALRMVGNRLVFVSGRSDVCQGDTIDWLVRHCDLRPDEFQLRMRAEGDFRPDTVVKYELYKKWIEPIYRVLCVLDDRDCVVAMWREQGLTCLQVAPGPF